MSLTTHSNIDFNGNKIQKALSEKITYYASPTGTGDGLTSGSPDTLANILAKLDANAHYEIQMQTGFHNLGTTAVSLNNLNFVRFVGISGTPTICTEHTKSANISTVITGSPSDSQTCTAHSYDEYPLDIQDSNVEFDGISILGTSNCIKINGGSIRFSGSSKLYFWIYDSDTEAYGLIAEDSEIRCDDTLYIYGYHNETTSKTLYAADFNASRFNLNNVITEFSHKGSGASSAMTFNNSANGRIAGYIQVLNQYRCMLLSNSRVSINEIRLNSASEPFTICISATENSDITITPNVNWQTGTNIVEATTYFLDAQSNSSITCGSGSYNVYCRGVNTVTNGYAFNAIEHGNIHIRNTTIYAENRASNLGFEVGIFCNKNSTVTASSLTLTTRQGGDDEFVQSGNLSSVVVSSGTRTTTNHETVWNGGRYVDSTGTLYDS